MVVAHSNQFDLFFNQRQKVDDSLFWNLLDNIEDSFLSATIEPAAFIYQRSMYLDLKDLYEKKGMTSAQKKERIQIADLTESWEVLIVEMFWV